MRRAFFTLSLILLTAPRPGAATSVFDLAFPELQFLHLYSVPEPETKPKKDPAAPAETKPSPPPAPPLADTPECLEGKARIIAELLREPDRKADELTDQLLARMNEAQKKELARLRGIAARPDADRFRQELAGDLAGLQIEAYAQNAANRAHLDEVMSAAPTCDGVQIALIENHFHFVSSLHREGGDGQQLTLRRSGADTTVAEVTVKAKGRTAVLSIEDFAGLRVPECQASPKHADAVRYVSQDVKDYVVRTGPAPAAPARELKRKKPAPRYEPTLPYGAGEPSTAK